MANRDHGNRRRRALLRCAAAVLLAATLGGRSAGAVTYVSAEPIPSEAIVGSAELAQIENLGYADRAQWAQLLLGDCRIVAHVIEVLSRDGATSTLNHANTHYRVAAGGYEGVTDPSYVFTIDDKGSGAASAADIFVLDNALGYALNQGGTAQFGLKYNPDDPNEFASVYAVVAFSGALTGEQAQAFFNFLGTINPALWTGANAGFTQINLPGSEQNDAMLFLIGNVPRSEFTKGLFKAASMTPGATYAPLRPGGRPTTATAGAAFPGNGWASPGGGYLENLPRSPTLVADLKRLRKRHLQAVDNLVQAIDQGDVASYLNGGFSCPQD